MAKRKLKRCILIVCEGTKTENDYFNYIAQFISLPNKVWDTVEVSDNITLPDDISIPAPLSLGKRKKRQLNNPNKHKVSNERNVLKELCDYLYGVDAGDLYKEIKAVPLRFVAQAQLIEEEQQLYEELWAVYDKDGHTYHKEAFDRAKKEVNHMKVQIGISSRSFEHWILLHFEKNKKAFDKTECKTEKGISVECDHSIGCKGKECLAGYIRVNTPLKKYKKSNSPEEFKKMMDVLLNKENLNRAFENAEWLRNEIQNDPVLKLQEIYDLNPYTNIDVLVKKLIE